jgi:hypothetical protein
MEFMAAVRKYIEYFGPMHDSLCPGDDTCECEYAPINAALNEGLAAAQLHLPHMDTPLIKNLEEWLKHSTDNYIVHVSIPCAAAEEILVELRRRT